VQSDPWVLVQEPVLALAQVLVQELVLALAQVLVQELVLALAQVLVQELVLALAQVLVREPVLVLAQVLVLEQGLVPLRAQEWVPERARLGRPVRGLPGWGRCCRQRSAARDSVRSPRRRAFHRQPRRRHRRRLRSRWGRAARCPGSGWFLRLRRCLVAVPPPPGCCLQLHRRLWRRRDCRGRRSCCSRRRRARCRLGAARPPGLPRPAGWWCCYWSPHPTKVTRCSVRRARQQLLRPLPDCTVWRQPSDEKALLLGFGALRGAEGIQFTGWLAEPFCCRGFRESENSLRNCMWAVVADAVGRLARGRCRGY
jgi:hypothetical protein